MSEIDLPGPETVRERASDAADGTSVNVLVGSGALDGTDPLTAATIRGDADSPTAYAGQRGAQAGLLAAAVTAVAGRTARLHYPEVELSADGPWLVLEPLGGRMATVARGSATVFVDVDREHPSSPDGSVDRHLEADKTRLSAVLEAARPQHEHYPVADDSRGVFTAGMTTFSLVSVDGDDETLTVALDVETTPVTAAGEIESRFRDCEGVKTVRLERTSGVRRMRPDPGLREAAENAQVAVLGDADYAWVSPDSALAAVPSANSLALGLGADGEAFDREQFADSVRILERTLDTFTPEDTP